MDHENFFDLADWGVSGLLSNMRKFPLKRQDDHFLVGRSYFSQRYLTVTEEEESLYLQSICSIDGTN